MEEITTGQIALFFGGILLAVVSFFLRDLYSSYQKLHDRVSEIEKEAMPNRLNKVETQMKQYDTNIEAFWKEFPKIVTEAITPHLNLISHQLDSISKRIDRIEDKEAKK